MQELPQGSAVMVSYVLNDHVDATLGHGRGSHYQSNADCHGHVVAHYPPRPLQQTCRTRQFEFHPKLPDVLLTGDRSGGASILDLSTNVLHPRLVIGPNPLLALVWLRHEPMTAVCGAARSGGITFMKYDPNASASEPALQRHSSVGAFPQLSSLSANCTDDFLLVSGITPDVAVYDVRTGTVLQQAFGVHEHLINISRFCNTSPHVFATASFDHTCRVWDLRQPLTPNRAVRTLATGGQNVMCCFSPDDTRLLCSGVDTRIMQVEVPSWRQTPTRFPLRDPVHQDRYRRSIYMSSGQHIVTAATEEAHMQLLSVEGTNLGTVDFRDLGQRWGTQPEGGNEMQDNYTLFVQSVRAHPVVPNRIGVLLCPDRGHKSCVTLVDIHPDALRESYQS